NVIPLEDAVKYIKDAIQATYGRKGDHIVRMNWQAVDRGIESLVKIEVPAAWAEAAREVAAAREVPDFISNILEPVNRQEGDKLPVSAFIGREDGTFPPGTSRYEKRGIAVEVPQWYPENCTQCNQCSFVCPHAAIRPFLLDEEEAARAPEDFVTLKATGKQLEGLSYRIQVSPLDCTGCGSCANNCPTKVKALVMAPLASQVEKESGNWDYAMTLSIKDNLVKKETIRGSQLAQPYLEFSGACAGCGETPYAKLLTQLFGHRMMIANATGCSSIWGGSAPSMPYCTDARGRGPAWANSLFEDNAEFGYGMHTAVEHLRAKLADLVEEGLKLDLLGELKEAFQEWLAGRHLAEPSSQATEKILPLLEKHFSGNDLLEEIWEMKDHFIKKSQWIIGGDGWAYDIGYGGLDHVLASGEDVNVLVFDTEVYSNTGGQASKASPTAAVAKFAASGKKIKKKDLGMMAMSYGYVYVAQIAMGANKNHTLKTLMEAESYPGPSLVIAYSPCINHGIYAGMGRSQEQQKKAVEAGYWHLYRYNPLLKDEGKNPFSLDSKEPTASFRDFLLSEVRYASLLKIFPEEAEHLFRKAEEDARERLNNYLRLAGN
ncbi:MAG TPA: pyruvate:ferredoxin (flavodoxin) oxidoreductase, partial [Clostridia bacterium]|nr:pyruvate:ferredoxin (flavodoxin) oxidoreductase [Clostridia bacterium]